MKQLLLPSDACRRHMSRFAVANQALPPVRSVDLKRRCGLESKPLLLVNELAFPVSRCFLHRKVDSDALECSYLSGKQRKCRSRRPYKVCSSNELETSNSVDAKEPVKAAFFDVDGTIVKSNVVMQYVNVRMAELSPIMKYFWLIVFAFKVPLYLLLDRIDRSLFSRAFYRNYEGRPVNDKEWMASVVYTTYMRPKLFMGAVKRIKDLKDAGFKIVLVTGSLDFLMIPLATELGVDHVYAARLKEHNGRMKGELEGDAMSRKEKAVLVRKYAEEHGMALRDCHAYGDSVADLAMLEEVGHPFAVRPDKRLEAIAKTRNWRIVDWLTDEPASSVIQPQT